MTDTMYLDASKDAIAMIASLRKGDHGTALLLASFYKNDPRAIEALCMALAAFGSSLLTAVDGIRAATDAAVLPSGDAVLQSVMMNLADENCM
jgi:hypothetical protein